MNRDALVAGGLIGIAAVIWKARKVDIKPGVILKGLNTDVMQPVIIAANLAAQRIGLKRATITSGLDGVHGENSLHPLGKALDFWRADWPEFNQPQLVQVQVRLMRDSLGPDYDVVLEHDHIHAEYDPKGEAVA